ncbi:IclR family transcriptional regulator [Peribacillus frigoritolerans]|uniref:IclR family transcriptional regulator n=1 Tax=Peribacillus frigoritolerans TaxID=450367 RepID=UPI002570FB70|nr:IclR family transcriptional regulator [Peribacillus frigoritolerans]
MTIYRACPNIGTKVLHSETEKGVFIFSEVIKTVEKSFGILEVIAQKPMTFIELVEKLDSNKATVHRFLSSLEQLGYITKNNQEKFILSQKWFQLAFQAQDQLDIVETARPFLESIAYKVQESVLLAQYLGDQVLYVEKVETNLAARIVLDVGKQAPLHCVASGKLYLAHLSPQLLERYLSKNPLKSFTENTITEKESLLPELKKIYERGYATDQEEWEKGLKGISFPIFNGRKELAGALCIAGLAFRFTDEQIEDIIEPALCATQEISKRLGYVSKGGILI